MGASGPLPRRQPPIRGNLAAVPPASDSMSLILITGTARGIGLELTRQLLAAGHEVIAVCRDPGSELPDLGCERIEGVELTHAADIERVRLALTERKLDVLIHNAGLLHRDGLGTQPIAMQQARVVDQHVEFAFRQCQTHALDIGSVCQLDPFDAFAAQIGQFTAGIAAHRDDFVACCEQLPSQFQTNAAGSAGNQDQGHGVTRWRDGGKIATNRWLPAWQRATRAHPATSWRGIRVRIRHVGVRFTSVRPANIPRRAFVLSGIPLLWRIAPVFRQLQPFRRWHGDCELPNYSPRSGFHPCTLPCPA